MLSFYSLHPVSPSPLLFSMYPLSLNSRLCIQMHIHVLPCVMPVLTCLCVCDSRAPFDTQNWTLWANLTPGCMRSIAFLAMETVSDEWVCMWRCMIYNPELLLFQSCPLHHFLSPHRPPPLSLYAAVSKSRPASMDLLLLHSRRSQTDLRPSHGRQLPQIPTSPQGSSQGGGGETGGDGGGGGGGGGEARDHTYTEVGLRNNPTPTHGLDDGLYESVGVREGDAGPKAPSAPPPTSANTPATIRATQSPPAQANGARSGNGNVST